MRLTGHPSSRPALAWTDRLRFLAAAWLRSLVGKRSLTLACAYLVAAVIPALAAEPAVPGDANPSQETTYAQRTDSFEQKLALLEAAWQKKDYRLARALVHSLRSTVLQTQIEQESPGTPLMPAARFATVESLPAAWRSWARGWKYRKAVNLDETAGLPRPPEPVELLLSCPAEQAVSLRREVRVAHVTAEGVLKEVPCQTYGGWNSNRLTEEGRRKLGMDPQRRKRRWMSRKRTHGTQRT